MNHIPIPEFTNLRDAFNYIASSIESVGEFEVANFRAMYLDTGEHEDEYNRRKELYSNGIYDEQVIVDGRPMMVGCDYTP